MNKARKPAADTLYKVKEDATKLMKAESECFHTTVAQGLFLSKRVCPDIQPTIAFLCTRVKNPTVEDWEKLVRLLQYLSGTKEKVLTGGIKNIQVLQWFVDDAYAVHNHYTSQTGAILSLGKGEQSSCPRSKSSTQGALLMPNWLMQMML